MVSFSLETLAEVSFSQDGLRAPSASSRTRSAAVDSLSRAVASLNQLVSPPGFELQIFSD